MVLQGIAPLYQGSKSEHSALCAVKCVLKSWRILMFLVNFFWFILSLKFCYFLCRFAVSSSVFSHSVVSDYIDCIGTLAMLHTRSKLFVYIWTCFWSSAFVLSFVFQMSFSLLPMHLHFNLADSRIFSWINTSHLCA